MRANIRSIGYTVTLEPHYKPWLFALDLPSAMPVIDVDPDAMGDLRTREVAGLTRSQQLVARTLVTQPLRYRQRSMLRDRYAADAARGRRRESAASRASGATATRRRSRSPAPCAPTILTTTITFAPCSRGSPASRSSTRWRRRSSSAIRSTGSCSRRGADSASTTLARSSSCCAPPEFLRAW